MASHEHFRRVTFAEIKIVDSKCEHDLYAYMHSNQQYILFLAANEPITEEKRKNLILLSGTNLFIRTSEEAPAAAPVAEAQPAAATEKAAEALKNVDYANAYESEVLGAKASEALKKVYQSLLDPKGVDVNEATKVIGDMTDAILNVVVPNLNDVRASVLKILKNMKLMNHSAVISSLAVMSAIANQFTSKLAFQSLTHAVLLMDAAFAELDDADVEQYYKDRKVLPTHTMDRIRKHPVRSLQLVEKLPLTNDTVNQLILMHHELHNGQGYHRGMRTANFSPLGRILAFAVDLYEHIKGAELNGQQTSIRDVIIQLEERNVEPHLRRHSAKLVENVKLFLGIK